MFVSDVKGEIILKYIMATEYFKGKEVLNSSLKQQATS